MLIFALHPTYPGSPNFLNTLKWEKSMKEAPVKEVSLITHQATLFELYYCKGISYKTHLVFEIIPVETSNQAIVSRHPFMVRTILQAI